jgi:tRNA threonylcarbamoyl adenosine modification protein YeaZ
MLTLAFDCSTSSMSIALLNDKKILGEKNYLQEAKHSEMLVLEIKNLLDVNKINFNDLDLIIATNGPGSYTGIRVALAVLKIIKITTQKPVLTVNCCEVLADKYSKNHEKINVAIQANSTEIYYAKYVIKNNFEEVLQPVISNVEDILLTIKEDEFLCGSGNKIFDKHLLKSNQDDVILAYDVAIYGQKKFLQNKDSQDILPLYLRDPKITKRK